MSETPQPPSSRDNDGTLKRLGSSVRNLFFYSEEEKSVMKAKPTVPDDPVSSEPATESDIALLLAIGRHTTTGGFVITIDGQRFDHWQALCDAGYVEQFVAIIDSVRQHAKKCVPTEHTPSPKAEQTEGQKAAAPLPPASTPAVQRNTQPTPDTQKLVPLEEQDEAIGSFVGNMRKAVRGRSKQDKAPSLLPPLNIADQIEEIVQDRLRTNDAMREKYIHIRPSVDGPLSIIVGNKQYEAVVDIEDADVRAFVQEAIREWEHRS